MDRRLWCDIDIVGYLENIGFGDAGVHVFEILTNGSVLIISRSGILSLVTIDILGWISYCCEEYTAVSIPLQDG